MHFVFVFDYCAFNMMKFEFLFKERISGLEILRPAISMYYLELEDITFSFYVSNGTNVSYSVNPGDGSKPKNTSTTSLIHKYKDSGM